ncbi:MAG: response regulator [Candidatus Cloacimonadota bacterium]|nr:MAG: response regulator [Candidatus Cloacimonadota bacterium]
MAWLLLSKGVMNKSVLIVDDEVAILQAFKKLIQRPGVTVDTAESIEETMSLLDRNDYNLVIADIRLSGVQAEEGLEILDHVKTRSPDTMVIIVTAHGSPDIMKRAYFLGADFYFEKPVSFKILNDAMKNLGIV